MAHIMHVSVSMPNVIDIEVHLKDELIAACWPQLKRRGSIKHTQQWTAKGGVQSLTPMSRLLQVGQGASIRPDILPAPYLEEMQKLQVIRSKDSICWSLQNRTRGHPEVEGGRSSAFSPNPVSAQRGVQITKRPRQLSRSKRLTVSSRGVPLRNS